MAFNESAFMKQKFEPRTAQVETSSLAAFFDKKEKPIWTVRGQTASELAATLESANTQKSLASIVEAIGENASKIDELKKVIGISNDVPGDIIKRLNQLAVCSVEPKIDHTCAVKLAETFPIEFYILTNKITELTGLGMEASVKKQKSSGTT